VIPVAGTVMEGKKIKKMELNFCLVTGWLMTFRSSCLDLRKYLLMPGTDVVLKIFFKQ
jgi:hypothetical protein